MTGEGAVKTKNGERGRLASIGRNAGVAFVGAVLHLDRPAYNLHAAELDEDAVAGALDHAPIVRGDGSDQSDRYAAPDYAGQRANELGRARPLGRGFRDRGRHRPRR
jgi:hypothetical protein